ncbi:methyltransferase domain-containing protein [Pelagibius litoralis]|uniref:Methyltransferase domain-containing protein n=1 Tax=Pelagibius litoralis TaxID=374515 RepID=A0A967CCE7_9PROT|nr:pseudaminic acid biosynthesis-associated methylase [Pelagibius litoralis]NIA69028.1 methyltransferase domain-containing protein [Pelagibius litoralis]
MTNRQVELWSSDFGYEYAERSGNRISEENLRATRRYWGRILKTAISPAPQSALEVGCNTGRNLIALSGYLPELHGVEPNAQVCEIARSNPALSAADIRNGHGGELPFEDNSIDLVFTCGVLIHVAPPNLASVVDEIVRVSSRYIACIEYFSPNPVEIEYRGMEGHLFKRDFGSYYLERHPDLRVRDYGFLWKPMDNSDNTIWWLFEKP